MTIIIRTKLIVMLATLFILNFYLESIVQNKMKYTFFNFLPFFRLYSFGLNVSELTMHIMYASLLFFSLTASKNRIVYIVILTYVAINAVFYIYFIWHFLYRSASNDLDVPGYYANYGDFAFYLFGLLGIVSLFYSFAFLLWGGASRAWSYLNR